MENQGQSSSAKRESEQGIDQIPLKKIGGCKERYQHNIRRDIKIEASARLELQRRGCSVARRIASLEEGGMRISFHIENTPTSGTGE